MPALSPTIYGYRDNMVVTRAGLYEPPSFNDNKDMELLVPLIFLSRTVIERRLNRRLILNQQFNLQNRISNNGFSTASVPANE